MKGFPVIGEMWRTAGEIGREESMSRNRKIVTSLLKNILKQGRLSGRDGLKGTPATKSSVVHQATRYLAELKMSSCSLPVPVSLNSTLANLRHVAGDRKFEALVRLKAIRHLLILENIDIPRANANGQESDAVEDFIRQELGKTKPERAESKTAQSKRLGTRTEALAEIRRNYLLDLGERRFRGMSPDQIAEWLRLDDMEPAPLPEVNIAEQHKDELRKVLDMF